MFSSRFRLRALLVIAFAIGVMIAVLGNPVALHAQPAEEDLKVRVDALLQPSGRTVAGIPIAGHAFLPKLYAALDYQPVWTKAASIDALSKAIARSWEDGLVPADFHADYVKAAVTSQPQNVAEREIILSDALVRLLYQLYFGKVAPNGLDPNWNFERPVLDG